MSRKLMYGEKTVAVKIPVSKVGLVRSFVSSYPELEQLFSDWKTKVSGRENQPRWQHVSVLLSQFEIFLDRLKSDNQ